MKELNGTKYSCDECGYVYVKFDGKKPQECFQCGNTSFTDVTDEDISKDDTSKSLIKDIISFDQYSWKLKIAILFLTSSLLFAVIYSLYVLIEV